MAAPKGNQFWKLAPKQGRSPIWEDPEVLRKACEEYFESVVNHDLKEGKAFSYEGKVIYGELNKMRIMSIQGLCVFLGIVRQTWINYCQKDEFLEVTAYVSGVMYDYKLAGAAAGLLNPNIIARDLGLKDKTDITSDDHSIVLGDTERIAKLTGLLGKVEARLDESGQD